NFLLRTLLQSGWREDSARLFPSSQPYTIRPDSLDDLRRTSVGHPRISRRYQTHSDFSSDPALVYGRTPLQGGAGRPGVAHSYTKGTKEAKKHKKKFLVPFVIFIVPFVVRSPFGGAKQVRPIRRALFC